MRRTFLSLLFAALIIPSAGFAQSGQPGEICVPDEQRSEPSRYDILNTCFSRSGETLVFSVFTGGGDEQNQGPDEGVDLTSPSLWQFYGDGTSGAARNYQDDFGGADVENCDGRLTYARTSTVAQWTVPEDCMPAGDYRFSARTYGPFVSGDEAAAITVTVRDLSPEVTPTPTPSSEPRPTVTPGNGDGEAVGRRIAGPSRYETAVAISRTQFPDGAAEVSIVNASVQVDALPGSVLPGPILYVPADCGQIPQVVVDEIWRLAPDQVTALGGVSAVCDQQLEIAVLAANHSLDGE